MSAAVQDDLVGIAATRRFQPASNTELFLRRAVDQTIPARVVLGRPNGQPDRDDARPDQIACRFENVQIGSKHR